MNRREYLATSALTGALASGGCLNWFRDDDADTDADENNATESEQTDADGGGTNQGEQDVEKNDTAENTNTEREQDANETDGNESEPATESDQEAEDEKPIAPDENETEIDREQYNESEPVETEERPASDIAHSVEEIERGHGRVTVTVQVRNVSTEPIDIVEIEILFYTDNGRYLDSAVGAVHDLGAGASERVEIEARTDAMRGDPDEIEIEATPLERVDG